MIDNARQFLALALGVVLSFAPVSTKALLLNKQTFGEPESTTKWMSEYRQLYAIGGIDAIRKQAGDGDHRAEYALLTLALHGGRSDIDVIVLAREFERLGQLGLVEADYLLGTLYWSCPWATFSPEDCRSRTLAALRRAFAVDFPPAISALAQLLNESSDPLLKISDDAAIRMLERAVAAGDPSGMAALANLLERLHPSDAASVERVAQLRTRASELGEPQALAWRALQLEAIGGDENLEQAFAFLMRAEAEVSAPAGAELARFVLRHPAFGGRLDKDVVELLGVACRRSLPRACSDAAGVLLSRHEGSEAASQALEYLETGVAHQDVAAMTRLANLKREGKVTARDVSGALELYTRAANAGGTTAKFNLALMFIRGDGVQKNVPRARMLLRDAADAGHQRAALLLERLRDESGGSKDGTN